MSLTIDIKSAGPAGTLSEDRQARVELASSTITLRDLIAEKVRYEVECANDDLKAAGPAPQAQTTTNEEEIAAALAAGGTRARSAEPIDAERAIATALRAFSSQRFIVYVDGAQPTALDEVLHLQANSEIVFVRILPLVGG